MFRSVRWRIAVPYTLLILVAMGILSFVLARVAKDAALVNLTEKLATHSQVIAESVGPALASSEDAADINERASRWANLLSERVTIVAGDGRVLGESHAAYREMENHLRRPEIQQAAVTGSGIDTRFSETLQTEMIFAAHPIVANGDLVGFARVSVPVDTILTPIDRQGQTILTAAMITTALALIMAVVIAERIVRPVRRLTTLARQMAAGNLSVRLLIPNRDEVGSLTLAFNEMGEQLREKVDTLAEERSRLTAVLELMADGVLIVDRLGRVQLINPAAAQLLETEANEALEKSFAQVTKHHQFIELWQRCRESGEEQVETVEIGQRDLFVQTLVAPLRQNEEETLVIFQNLTPIRRLQTVRRDFVSNISHELRTPLASLKAVVETLRDVALDDPPAAQRFLDRAEYEVDALAQMVQELLELSRIESGKVPLKLEPTDLEDVVTPVLDRLRPQAERGGVAINVELPQGIPLVLVDPERIGQVVTNLVHNAIKFTPPGGEIAVRAEIDYDDDMITVRVRDDGAGISATDLPRIFERFFKSDRARSGGGTGLGLAIVRHLVRAHGGEIWAKSKEGKGSTFYFTLPTVDLAEREGEDPVSGSARSGGVASGSMP